MTRKHLKHFVFEWKPDAIPRTPTGRFTSEGQEIVNEVTHALTRDLALNTYVYHALRKAKVCVGDPPIVWTRVVLTTKAKEKPYFDPEPFLYVDVPYDPLELCDVPMDIEYIGELFIRLTEEALLRLGDFPGFPCDIIKDACEEFRNAGYIFPFKAGECMIPGTHVKGQIHAVVSGVSTTRYFTALYRNKQLFRTKISERDGGEMTISGRFNGFEFDNGIVTVPGDQYYPFSEDEMPDWMKPVSIDLRDYPETFEFMREKGWVT